MDSDNYILVGIATVAAILFALEMFGFDLGELGREQKPKGFEVVRKSEGSEVQTDPNTDPNSRIF